MLKNIIFLLFVTNCVFHVHSQNREQMILKAQNYIESRFDIEPSTLLELKNNLAPCFDDSMVNLISEI